MTYNVSKGRKTEIKPNQTQYNKSYLTFVSNFKILGTVVPEKALTEICLITLEWEMEK